MVTCNSAIEFLLVGSLAVALLPGARGCAPTGGASRTLGTDVQLIEMSSCTMLIAMPTGNSVSTSSVMS